MIENMILDRSKMSILVVEDSRVQAEQIKHMLEQERYRVAAVENGAEALAFLEKQIPTLIVSDIVMPGMKGIEAVQQIKDVSPNTKVVILTTRDEPEYRADAEAAGASAYVLKDEVGEELIPVLERLLSDPTR